MQASATGHCTIPNAPGSVSPITFPWLTQRWTAFGVILLTDVWLWTPWFALILLAGLQSLPPEPFEAARIDAASAWRTFRYITLPMLRPVMVVCIVIRAIDAFRTFDIVWTISGGGPARATEVFSIYAYVEAFQFLNLARGSAARSEEHTSELQSPVHLV